MIEEKIQVHSIEEALELVHELSVTYADGGIIINGYFRGCRVSGYAGSGNKSFEDAVKNLKCEFGIGD